MDVCIRWSSTLCELRVWAGFHDRLICRDGTSTTLFDRFRSQHAALFEIELCRLCGSRLHSA